jgi:hypothetical protein
MVKEKKREPHLAEETQERIISIISKIEAA